MIKHDVSVQVSAEWPPRGPPALKHIGSEGVGPAEVRRLQKLEQAGGMHAYVVAILAKIILATARQTPHD